MTELVQLWLHALADMEFDALTELDQKRLSS